MLLGSSMSIRLSIFTGNFLPTYFLPIRADKESPNIVKINPETVWSCFKITVTKACKDENKAAEKIPINTERNKFPVFTATMKPLTAPTEIIPSTPRLRIHDFSVINSPRAAMKSNVAACRVAFKRPIN